MVQNLEIMQAAISEIFKRERGDVPLDIQPLHGGVVNAVFSVQLPDRNFVIRLKEDSLAVYRKEKWVMECAAVAGVKVPEVFAVGQSETLSYMIIEKIEGVPGSAYKGDPTPLLRELGRMARIVNEIEVEGFGFHLEMQPTPHFTESWQDMMSWEKEFIFGTDTLLSIGALNKQKFERAQRFLEPMQHWKFPPRLSHSDISLENMMLSNEGVVYLIDWTQAKGSPAPYFDIGNFAGGEKNPLHIETFFRRVRSRLSAIRENKTRRRSLWVC